MGRMNECVEELVVGGKIFEGLCLRWKTSIQSMTVCGLRVIQTHAPGNANTEFATTEGNLGYVGVGDG